MDTAVDMAEHIAEVMEDVAGKVDKVIDSITDDLPEDSKLRKRLEAIDELIEGVAMSAHIANDIIDKVWIYWSFSSTYTYDLKGPKLGNY